MSEGVLRAERGATLLVLAGRGHAPHAVVRRFEGWCEEHAGGIRRRSGPPPSPSPRLPAPSQADLDGAEAAVAEVARVLGNEAWVAYCETVATRITIAGQPAPAPRAVAYWSLTGAVPVPGIGTFPLGWSGSGNGRATLASPVRLAGLEHDLCAFRAARALPTGPQPAVLSAAAAALVVHETIGHTAEATLAECGPALTPIGARVASELVSVVDDPLAPGAPAHYEEDDEGVAVRGATPVVESGVLVGHLHSAATAHAASAPPTANARAADGLAPPLPRMSNLICAAGDRHEDALLEELWNGLYVHRLADGWAQSGRVGARIVLAEDVRRGRRTGRYRTGAQVDERDDVLFRAQALGSSPTFNPNAMCGKAAQVLSDVGTAAPAIRLSELVLVA